MKLYLIQVYLVFSEVDPTEKIDVGIEISCLIFGKTK